jgi:ribosomal peptide maturation radical SAM protein 1
MTFEKSSPPGPQCPVRIALVNMPFAMANRPSIQCGLLKASVQQAGHEAEVFYLNLEFAAEIGADLYRHVSHSRTDHLLGEWLFSGSVFDDLPEEAEFLRACDSLDSVLATWSIDSGRLCELRRDAIPAWLDQWAEKIEWDHYTVVGFTSTFEQNNAAFALARRIKERYPEVIILFGGANFDGVMGREYIRALGFIDYAVSGEGDRVLPEILECIRTGENPLKIQGVFGRLDGKVVGTGLASRIDDMDSLPDPDYDEYFATLSRFGAKAVLGDVPPQLLFETSRGCWWGEKQHCTFCGLNANGMKFRAKSPSAAVAQLERLSSKYEINLFQAVDNIIDYRYLEQLCGPLAEEHFDYRIFYEVKANLRPRDLRVMRRAGISRIQPGVESLSSHILSLMRKGITMLRNVRLLKWAHYYGMQVSWNLLTGFPGETIADYAEQSKLAALLRHLPPPNGVGRIWLERFSPYFFDRSFPVKNIRPLDAYRFVYPEGSIDLEEVAYYFDCEMDATLPDDHHQELRRQVEEWRIAWARQPRPSMVYQRAPGWIRIADRRANELCTYSFRGWEADIYELCGDTERSVESLSKLLGERGAEGAGIDEIQSLLEKFCDLGIMIQEKNSYLSLALPVNRYW